MKRLATVSGAAVVMLSALILPGCGSSNNFGASVDLVSICAFAQGETSGTCQSNPEVSLSFGAPLTAELEVINRMSGGTGTGSDTGLTARLATVEIDYRTPSGQAIPLRREQLAQNVSPSATETVPVTLVSFEQVEYVKTHRSRFPQFPFQVNLHVTVKYDTTGAVSGTVERLFTVEFVD
jgi:hypothetical protein